MRDKVQRQRIATVFGKWGVQEGGVHEKHLNGVWMPVFFLNRREKGRVKRPFRLKVKKVEKTTRPFRYDLNQIPYDYTVEVRNRFKGLDLIDRVPDELWMEVCDIVQEALIKKGIDPQEKEMQKSKMAV